MLFRYLSFLLTGSILVLGGCPSNTNFRSEDHRLTQNTAYVVPTGDFEVGAGLVGTDYENLGVSLPVRVGLPEDYEVRSNLGHMALGIPNAAVEKSMEGEHGVQYSASLGIQWLHPPNITFLPDTSDDVLGNIHLISIPARLTGTMPLGEWGHFNVTGMYIHSEISGTFGEADSNTAGAIGAREVAVIPDLTLYLFDYAALSLGAQVPVYAEIPARAGGQQEIEEGVIVGFEASSSTPVDVLGLYTIYSGLEFHYGDVMRLRLTGVYGLRFLTQRLEAFLPGFELYARF